MYRVLERVRGIRESSRIKDDMGDLLVRIGSLDREDAKKASEQYLALFGLQPERDSLNAETVDLIEQMEKYSPEEQKEILNNLIGLECTRGCNGGCPFCLFGEKKGVTYKYSFESIRKFFNKYKRDLPEEFFLYWNTDPFDYREGEHNFSDIYKAYRKIRPDSHCYVSTSIPKGGVEDFIYFVKMAMREQIKRASSKKDSNLTIRLSVGKHNASRVESVLTRLVSEISHDSESSYTREQIDNFFKNCFEVGSRVNTLNLGPNIEKHDDIRGFSSPVRSDGTVIGPLSSKAFISTFPTVYEPSGCRVIDLYPGSVFGVVPKLYHSTYYQVSPSEEGKAESNAMGFQYFEMIQTSRGERYKLPDKTENLILNLGRRSQEIANIIYGFSRINSERFKGLDKAKDDFKAVTKILLFEKGNFLQKNIDEAERLIIGGKVKGEEFEKLSFYVLLGKVYYAMGDFLASEIDKGRSTQTLGNFALVLGEVGKKQALYIDKIMAGLVEIEQSEFPINPEARKKFLKEAVLEKVGRYFFSKDDDKPGWFNYLLEAYE